MTTILFYAPFNQRSRDTESLMLAFHKQGHKVFCLSQQEGYLINDFLKANGIIASSYVVPGKRSGWWYFCRHLFFFVKFCFRNRIKIVYSHLEPANFVASLGQYFVRAKVYLCRHHVDEGRLYEFDRDVYYRVTYRLARRIIVVSDRARKYMVEREGVPERKIIHVNLAYDFGLYKEPNPQNVNSIRSQYNSNLLLLTACRLTAFKRPELAVHLVRKLTDLGLDVKLIMLGKGEMLESLELLIKKLNLEERIFVKGYVDNVLEFMEAADLFLHPSVLDSSCVAIKEAGLAKLPPIMCHGIGDFEDYIRNKENGFLVDQDKFVEHSLEIIVQYSQNSEFLKKIGLNLRRSILELFSVEKVISRYDSLNTFP